MAEQPRAMRPFVDVRHLVSKSRQGTSSWVLIDDFSIMVDAAFIFSAKGTASYDFRYEVQAKGLEIRVGL